MAASAGALSSRAGIDPSGWRSNSRPKADRVESVEVAHQATIWWRARVRAT